MKYRIIEKKDGCKFMTAKFQDFVCRVSFYKKQNTMCQKLHVQQFVGTCSGALLLGFSVVLSVRPRSL